MTEKIFTRIVAYAPYDEIEEMVFQFIFKGKVTMEDYWKAIDKADEYKEEEDWGRQTYGEIIRSTLEELGYEEASLEEELYMIEFEYGEG